MSTPTTINESAPVVVRHTTTINAPIQRVWALHTDVSRWTQWQNEITAASSPSPLTTGDSFTWTSFGFTVTSTIYALDNGSLILWGGEASGIMGIHEWTFHTTDAGTLVRTAESFAGSPVDDARDELRSQLDFSLTSWLENLKTAAETNNSEILGLPGAGPTRDAPHPAQLRPSR